MLEVCRRIFEISTKVSKCGTEKKDETERRGWKKKYSDGSGLCDEIRRKRRFFVPTYHPSFTGFEPNAAEFNTHLSEHRVGGGIDRNSSSLFLSLSLRLPSPDRFPLHHQRFTTLVLCTLFSLSFPNTLENTSLSDFRRKINLAYV